MRRLLLVTALLLAGCGGSSASRAPEPLPENALRSRPDLQPPVLSIDRLVPEMASGALTFISPRLEDVERDGKTMQQGAMAIDDLGRTVLWMPVSDAEPVTDLRVQRYKGKRVLTWWQGKAVKGEGKGAGFIADEAYRVIATVRAGNGETADLHEFDLTDRGTALLTIYSRAERDGRLITQGVLQEVDVETGRVVWEWDSLDHVDPSESVEPPPKDRKASWDYFHVNSVAEDGPDHFIVSARNTSAVYRIRRSDGTVDWRLGGKRSDFELGEGVEFGLQHDARPVAEDVVRLFDNVGTGKQPASVKVIRLDRRNRTALLERRVVEPDGMTAQTQGNAQELPDGRLTVGWGSVSAISRYGPGGRLHFDAHLPAEYDTYRAFRFKWVGRPGVPPVIHARRHSGQVTIWASWNGATQVRAWQVLAGRTPDRLEPLGAPADWQGLETTIVRMTGAPYVAVAALSAGGRELGRSAPARLAGGS